MEERCTPRQIWTAFFVGLLAAASALPGVLAPWGTLGWLAPGLVFPLGLVVLWGLRRLGEDGLAQALKRHRLLLTLYYIWTLTLSALTAGGCIDRLCRTDYQDTPNWLLSLVLTAAALCLVRRGRGAFFRAVEIFFLALLVVLALFFTLGAVHLRWENLSPQSWGEAAGAAKGVLPVGGSMAVGVLCGFFPREPGTGKGWRWLGGWCLTASGLFLLVVGALGAPLAAKAPLPLFLALQGLGLPGGFQRLEALGTAAWVLSDLALLGLCALAGREMAGGKAWAQWPPLLCALFGGGLLPNGVVKQAAGWLLGVNLVLGGLLPVVFSLGKTGKRAGGDGISCG